MKAFWTVIEASRPSEAIGVLVVDGEHNELHTRFRRDLDEVWPDDADVLAALEDDLHEKARELGAERLVGWLEENASNFIRVAEREAVAAGDFRGTVQWLYHKHVRPKVLPFRTHLPVYGMQAAAGKWGPGREVDQEPETWIEAPPDLRISDDLFVARVTGRSMEPLIPAESLCVFRSGVAGSRQGRRVLVANWGEPGEQRFTVKRYESTASPGTEGRRIVLHPLNPEYEPWEIDPEDSDRVAVIAEFVTVLGPG